MCTPTIVLDDWRSNGRTICATTPPSRSFQFWCRFQLNSNGKGTQTLPCTSEVCSGARKVCKLGVPAKASTKYQPVASQPLEKLHRALMWVPG
ncbi:hypothetical protein LSAT2_001919 [Lamellibrachia satsuma]|nr:hypothetical protein LSAT2_001919 [Lamellibrachia satsuma]